MVSGYGVQGAELTGRQVMCEGFRGGKEEALGSLKSVGILSRQGVEG